MQSNLQVLVQPTQPNENVVEDEETVIHHLVVCHFAFINNTNNDIISE